MAKSSTRKTPTKMRKTGTLPEWDLTDLYPGIDSPELKWDLENSENQCVEFERAFKGRLQALATGEGAGGALAAAVKRYEALEDRLGRLISYCLLYTSDAADE